MQAIARLNRGFRDKPAGRVVDHIGIAQNVQPADGILTLQQQDASKETSSC
jgi:type I site-specific restriction-modification system R (restriction) subunit